MSGRGRPTKSEIILLGLTAVFLCALAGLSLRDRQDRVPGVVIETEAEVPREEIAPDFPPVDSEHRHGGGAGHAARHRGEPGPPDHRVPGGQRPLREH